MKNNFRIRLCSDLDYEEMVVDICFEDNTVATVTQEKGPDNLEIEIFPPPVGTSSWKFTFEGLESAIKEAKERLIKSKKIDLS